jgi:proteasome accessory factor A
MSSTKFIARDCELSTSAVGADGRPIDSWKATRKVLAQLPAALEQYGTSTWCRNGGSASAYSMDCLRQWTSGGQCFYSDMSHVEVCTAETSLPSTFALQNISVIRAAEAARRLAEEVDDEEVRITLGAANADPVDPKISWGQHLNVSTDEKLWEDLFVNHAHPALLGYVSSAIAAGIVFFGGGYLLPFKDGSVVYSLSGRAHHLSCVHSLSTTIAFQRGILNTRREPHAKNDRLHLIGFDFSLLSARLLASYVQCVLAAAEEGYCGLILYEPVRALRTWSWGLDLRSGRLKGESALVDGRKMTLPVYMQEMCRQLLRMCEGGLLTADVVPEAAELLPRIIELAEYAEEGSMQYCARHLDWAAKLMVLYGSDQPLGSPAARLADHDFTHTNPQRSMLWRLHEQGLIDPLVSWDEAEKCLTSPPTESRAWGRGKLIERFHDEISDVDWGEIEFRSGNGFWSPRVTIDMPCLDQFTESDVGQAMDSAEDLSEFRRMINNRRAGMIRETDPLDDIGQQLASSNDGA